LETTFGTKQNLEQIIGEQLSVQGNFKTGQIKHQLFTGVDMENSFLQAYTLPLHLILTVVETYSILKILIKADNIRNKY
jgi:outer membrane receptor for monomeric catechols